MYLVNGISNLDSFSLSLFSFFLFFSNCYISSFHILFYLELIAFFNLLDILLVNITLGICFKAGQARQKVEVNILDRPLMRGETCRDSEQLMIR